MLLFAPPHLAVLVPPALVLYVCCALTIVVLMRHQADTVEYGQLKLGRRNGAVTFAIQPFVNKTSAPVSTAIVSAIVLLSGVNDAANPSDVQPYGLWLIRLTMFGLPAILATTGYHLWRLGFVVDEERHAQIVAELERRGDLSPRPRSSE